MKFPDIVSEALGSDVTLMLVTDVITPGPLRAELGDHVIDVADVNYALLPERGDFRRSVIDGIRTWSRSRGHPCVVIIAERPDSWHLMAGSGTAFIDVQDVPA